MTPSSASRPDNTAARSDAADGTVRYTKAQELRSFLFLTVVMAPVLTVLVVAGFGFLVWIYQVISGPPTGG
jgi:nitrate reductase NapE